MRKINILIMLAFSCNIYAASAPSRSAPKEVTLITLLNPAMRSHINFGPVVVKMIPDIPHPKETHESLEIDRKSFIQKIPVPSGLRTKTLTLHRQLPPIDRKQFSQTNAKLRSIRSIEKQEIVFDFREIAFFTISAWFNKTKLTSPRVPLTSDNTFLVTVVSNPRTALFIYNSETISHLLSQCPPERPLTQSRPKRAKKKAPQTSHERKV